MNGNVLFSPCRSSEPERRLLRPHPGARRSHQDSSQELTRRVGPARQTLSREGA